MFNAQEFRAQLSRMGYTQRRLAKELGMSDNTMTQKIKTGKFTLVEANEIGRILQIKDPVPIFFSQE